jgi:hypothetical protein
MHTTIREALQALVTAMTESLVRRNELAIDFTLTEDLIKGTYALSSTVCPYTLRLRLSSTVEQDIPTVLEADVVFDLGDALTAEETMLNGDPTIRFPLGAVDVNNEVTYEHLLMGLISFHPFTSARHLRLFSIQSF